MTKDLRTLCVIEGLVIYSVPDYENVQRKSDYFSRVCDISLMKNEE